MADAISADAFCSRARSPAVSLTCSFLLWYAAVRVHPWELDRYLAAY